MPDVEKLSGKRHAAEIDIKAGLLEAEAHLRGTREACKELVKVFLDMDLVEHAAQVLEKLNSITELADLISDTIIE